MGAAFSAFFASLTYFFSAFGKVAESADVLATSGLRMSQQHLANADFERHKQQLELQAKIKELEIELALSAPAQITSKP